MKKLKNLSFKSIFDNRIVQILIPFIAMYNLFNSYIIFRKEGKLMQNVINENDEFFTAMATMNFSPDEEIPFALTSKMEVNSIFTLEDIQSIARETIIKTVMEFVKSEELLGIVLVKCLFTDDKKHVQITLQPAHYQVFSNDKADLLQSIKIYLFGLLPIAAIIWYFFIR